jgi:glycosyltransferase involved in cell wall biosynthesis
MTDKFLRAIRRRVRNTRAYRLAREVKGLFDRERNQRPHAKVVSLKPPNPTGKNVLLSYIIDPFLLEQGQAVSTDHTHDWESLQIARTFLEMGYSVDVISFQNREFIPRKQYSVVIDARHNLERLLLSLPKDCLKIMHIDSAHILFHNHAEAARLLDLQRRRGVTLRPRRWEMPNLCIEHADCATVLGNEFTMSTFRYARKAMHRVPISSHLLYPWPDGKDFAACRNQYLWFGSGGLVHKGLDLVLDAFAEMPDCHLTICGPISQEKDFEAAYYRELYQLPNIHTAGWMDVSSAEFTNILNKCAAIVYPSCSEGGGGSVINCMHGALIPIVSREASVDVDPAYGVTLEASSVSAIKEAVRDVATSSPERLEKMARQSWEYVRINHTREAFAKIYRNVIANILGPNSSDAGSGFVEANRETVSDSMQSR